MLCTDRLMSTAGVRLEPSPPVCACVHVTLLLSASFVLAATYLVYTRMLEKCTSNVTLHDSTFYWITRNKQEDKFSVDVVTNLHPESLVSKVYQEFEHKLQAPNLQGLLHLQVTVT